MATKYKISDHKVVTEEQLNLVLMRAKVDCTVHFGDKIRFIAKGELEYISENNPSVCFFERVTG